MAAVSRQKAAVEIPGASTFEAYLAMAMPDDVVAETELDPSSKPEKSRVWFKRAARVRYWDGRMGVCWDMLPRLQGGMLFASHRSPLGMFPLALVGACTAAVTCRCLPEQNLPSAAAPQARGEEAGSLPAGEAKLREITTQCWMAKVCL